MPRVASVADQDEKFWREQEKRLTQQIGQPCCTLAGICSVLSGLPGPFAVVVHGERDCLNSFVHYQGVSSNQFYCTNMSQLQFATGQTAEPLRRCLEFIARERSPSAILVLGTCLTEMIHDDFETVAREVSQRAGIPVLTLRTSGLQASSQTDMLDWLFSTLAQFPKASAGDRLEQSRARRLNLIGAPSLENGQARQELSEILGKAGLELNGSYPYDVSFADWGRLTHAAANFVVDPTLYPKLLSQTEGHGVPSIDVPLPVGITQTRRFFRKIGSYFGVEGLMEKAIRPWAQPAEKRLEAFRKRFAGLRLALGLRMVNNYRSDQLAYDGLGDLAAFTEAGFDVTLLIQGPPEEKSRRHFRDRLEQLGCRLAFVVFPDPYDLPPLLRAGRFDLAYLADHARGEARQAGVPMVRSRCLEPFFRGAQDNLDYLETILNEIGVTRGKQPHAITTTIP